MKAIIAKKRKANCRSERMISLTPTFQNSAREKIKDAMLKGNISCEDNDIKSMATKIEIIT